MGPRAREYVPRCLREWLENPLAVQTGFGKARNIDIKLLKLACIEWLNEEGMYGEGGGIYPGSYDMSLFVY